MYIEVSNMNLKDRKLQEAKTKLKVLEEKLKFLEFSNLQDKEEKIIDCKHPRFDWVRGAACHQADHAPKAPCGIPARRVPV